MEAQRKKVLQEARAKEQEKFRQMEERRKALEVADWERREALRKKNQVTNLSYKMTCLSFACNHKVRRDHGK